MLINRAQAYKHLSKYPGHRLYPKGYVRSVEDVEREMLFESTELTYPWLKDIDWGEISLCLTDDTCRYYFDSIFDELSKRSK